MNICVGISQSNMVNTSWAGCRFMVGLQDHWFQVKSTGTRGQEELAAHPSLPGSWYLISSQLCAMGDTVGSSSWVAPNVFSVVIWECVEIRVSLFSSGKDFLFPSSAGSGALAVIGARSLATDFLCDAEQGT